jgi:hypothetical protein
MAAERNVEITSNEFNEDTESVRRWINHLTSITPPPSRVYLHHNMCFHQHGHHQVGHTIAVVFNPFYSSAHRRNSSSALYPQI